MDYKTQNDELRKYFERDFTPAAKMLDKLRECLITGEKADFEEYNKDNILKYDADKYVYISVFQEFQKPIRFGSKRENLSDTLNRIVERLRCHKNFKEFDLVNKFRCRIMYEVITKITPVDINKVHLDGEFDETRFEPGVTGLMLKHNDNVCVFMPSDSAILSHMTFKPALLTVANKTKLFSDIPANERIEAVKKLEGAEFFLTESQRIISFEDRAIPLYRDNVLFKDFDYNTLLEIFNNSTKWLEDNMIGNGQFTYYYDANADNNIDHEHPTRRPPNLYYNDLRHSGGIITYLRMYEFTGNKKYLDLAKSCIDWVVRQIRFHEDNKGRECAYVYANAKAKLGGVGIPLITFMRYRMDSNDESYDRYIEGFARHIISRMTPDGELMGYYIHPMYHNGEPLIEMTPEERKQTFSFYYPGEALMGLGMFVNNYSKNEDLKKEVTTEAKKAMRWIIDDRPKLYKDLFTALPSDGWLMQAIQEWAHLDGFVRQEDIDFVFNDAQTMMDKTYKRDDSPYIDFEGGMYYNYGDHYYPDGARCEGLISAYYLADFLGEKEKASKILEACKKAALSQFQLYISKYNNFVCKNPKRAEGGIKFKVTRQWIRVDSIQHVACFFMRLYWTEHSSYDKNLIAGK